MQLPRWNNCKNPRTRGKTAQPSISHSGQGLEGKKSSSLPVEGGIFSLTFPFIEQAISPLENCWRNGELVLKNSLRRRVFPQGSFFRFVFSFGSGCLRACHRWLRSHVEEPHQSFQVLCH